MEEFVVSTWPLLKPFFHPAHVPEEPAAGAAEPEQEQDPHEELTAEEAELAADDLVTPGTGTVEELDTEEVRAER